MDGRRLKFNYLRIAIVVAILALLLPTLTAGLATFSPNTDEDVPPRSTAQNVTFVSSQHGSIVAIHTPTKQTIWRHDSFQKYYDVEQLNRSVILFSARTGPNESTDRKAVRMNWRTGEKLSSFKTPSDTHDVDYYDTGEYVIADKEHHRIYIYEPSTGTTSWSYNFSDHFPESAGGTYEGDWTHLNDVDVVRNGSAVLVDPRNFDRVLLVNVSTKEVTWTLGEENNHDILYEQHNPVLLSTDPPTVLIADSENDRIVEYRKVNGSWEMIWGYRGNLNWPRDADRLPNGNTLIADSGNDRAVVVTPDHEIVWEVQTDKMTYDIDTLRHGDDAAGPPMTNFQSEYSEPIDPRHDMPPIGRAVRDGAKKGYFYASWILPPFVEESEFYTLALAGLLAIVWGGLEGIRQVPAGIVARANTIRVDTRSVRPAIRGVGIVGVSVVAFASFIAVIEGGRYAGQLGGLAVALLGVATEQFSNVVRNEDANTLQKLSSVAVPTAGVICFVTGVGMFVIADVAGVVLYYAVGTLLLVQAGRLLTDR